MTPLYFGSAKRRLFGVYAPPRAASVSAGAALLCCPWGQEYLRAHRSMRQLAGMLCAAGRHVMRFDYFGSGDSAGDSAEMTLSGWEQDVETAMEELQDTCGATRVVLIGLRLGAAVATRVAVRKSKAIEALVLWDPVVSGPEYLEEAAALATSKNGGVRVRAVGTTTAASYDVLGFPLTAAFADEVRTLDLLKLVPSLPKRTRLIASAPLASHEALRAELEQQARTDITINRIDSLFAWRQYQGLGAGAVPTKVLDAIVEWVRS
jgi:pimeloyl-ACP methyl ester carboxylesterase